MMFGVITLELGAAATTDYNFGVWYPVPRPGRVGDKFPRVVNGGF